MAEATEAGRGAHPHDRHRRRRRAAPRSPPPRPTTTVFAAIGHHPNEATGYDDAITAELRELAAHPRCLAIGETGPRRLPRLRAARRPGARVPRADRARAGARQAAGHPHPRGRGRHDRHAGRARRGPRRRAALLLDARPPRRVPRARLVDLVRRQRDLPEVGRPRRRRRARAARPPAGGDRRAVPDAAGGPQASATGRPTSSTRPASSPSGAGSPTRSWMRPSTRTRRGCWAGERPPGAAEPAPHEGRSASARTASSARTS